MGALVCSTALEPTTGFLANRTAATSFIRQMVLTVGAVSMICFAATTFHAELALGTTFSRASQVLQGSPTAPFRS